MMTLILNPKKSKFSDVFHFILTIFCRGRTPVRPAHPAIFRDAQGRVPYGKCIYEFKNAIVAANASPFTHISGVIPMPSGKCP